MPSGFSHVKYPFTTREGKWESREEFERKGKIWRTALGAHAEYGFNEDTVRSWEKSACPYLGRKLKTFRALRPLSRTNRVAVFLDEDLSEAHQQYLAIGKNWLQNASYPVKVKNGQWTSETHFVSSSKKTYVTVAGAIDLGCKKNIVDWITRPCRSLGNKKIGHLKVPQPYGTRVVIVLLLDHVSKIAARYQESAETDGDAAVDPKPDDDRGQMVTNRTIQETFGVSAIFAPYWAKQPSTLRPGEKALRSEEGIAPSKKGRSKVMLYALADARNIQAGLEGAGPNMGNSKRRLSKTDREDKEIASIRELLRLDGPMPLGTFQTRMLREHGIKWERASNLKSIERDGKKETVFCTWPVGGRQFYAGLPSQKNKLPNEYVDTKDGPILATMLDRLKANGPMILTELQDEVIKRHKCSIPTIARIRESHKDKFEEKIIGPINASEAKSKSPWKTWIGLSGATFPVSAVDERLQVIGTAVEAILRDCGDLSTADLKAEFKRRTASELSSDELSLCHRGKYASITVEKGFPRVFRWRYDQPPANDAVSSTKRLQLVGPITVEVEGPVTLDVDGSVTINDRRRKRAAEGKKALNRERKKSLTMKRKLLLLDEFNKLNANGSELSIDAFAEKHDVSRSKMSRDLRDAREELEARQGRANQA